MIHGGIVMARPEHRRFNSASVQALEDRRLLAADPLQVLIGLGAAKSVQYTDPNGTVVRVQLTGAGSASLEFDGTSLTQSSNSKGLIISGSGISLTDLTATGTLSTTTLQFVTTGKKTVNMGNITVSGALAVLSAPKCIAVGSISTSKWVGQLTLGGATNGSISVGPATGNPGLGLNASLGNVTNEIFRSAVRVNTLTASQWINAHDVNSSPNEISAGQIGTITIAHDATVNMETGAINTLTVRGTLSNSTIYLTTPLTPLKMNLTRLSAGALATVDITSNGNLGAISAKRMSDSSIQAGIVSTVTPLSLPLSTSDFKNTSSIGSITLSKSASASFSNSYIAAYTIGTTFLGSVSMTNTMPGIPFGIAAHKFSAFSLFALPGSKSIRINNPATNAVFDNVLSAKGITPSDFEVSVV